MHIVNTDLGTFPIHGNVKADKLATSGRAVHFKKFRGTNLVGGPKNRGTNFVPLFSKIGIQICTPRKK